MSDNNVLKEKEKFSATGISVWKNTIEYETLTQILRYPCQNAI